MGDVVNLRQARKTKARSAKEALATENRIKFGRTALDKKRDVAEVERKNRMLDGHRLPAHEDKPQ